MAIPSTPSNFYVKQADRQVYAHWDIVTGATTYTLQRSTDGVTFSTIAIPATNEYVDATVTVGTFYYYQVASTNSSGTSPYTSTDLTVPTGIVPAPNGEMSLFELRLRCQQKADFVKNPFVNSPEWDQFIELSMYELYDLLITMYEDYFAAPEILFYSNGNDYLYPLPDGALTFVDNSNNGKNTIVAPPYYKLLGVDLGLNSANNAYVTVNKYNFIDRNRFVYPNTASTIYGVFNLQYRIMGNKIRFIPTPAANQPIRLLYAPKLPNLLKESDLTTIGFSGWLNYVICRTAKYALDKADLDSSGLDNELLFLKGRIEESAANRDAGQPDRISDSRQGNWQDGWYGGRNGQIGGW